MEGYKEIDHFLDYIDNHISNRAVLKGGESTYPYGHLEKLLDRIYEYIRFIFENEHKNKQRMTENVYSKSKEHATDDTTVNNMTKSFSDYFNRPTPVESPEDPGKNLWSNSPEDPGKNLFSKTKEENVNQYSIPSISSLFSYESSPEPVKKDSPEESPEIPTTEKLLLKTEEMV